MSMDTARETSPYSDGMQPSFHLALPLSCLFLWLLYCFGVEIHMQIWLPVYEYQGKLNCGFCEYAFAVNPQTVLSPVLEGQLEFTSSSARQLEFTASTKYGKWNSISFRRHSSSNFHRHCSQIAAVYRSRFRPRSRH